MRILTQRRGGAKETIEGSDSLDFPRFFAPWRLCVIFSLHCLLLSQALLIFVGCGSGLPQTIPVSGRVTFDGQPPPAAGNVQCVPVEAAEGFPLRPASGAFGTDGRYRAQTFDPGDGLMPGKYTLSVECWDVPPDMSGNPSKSHVPKKYQSPKTSGLTLEIKPNMRSQVLDLDLVGK